jgi:hypothetical protein
MNQQRANIERVSDAIAVFVTKFLHEHLNQEFHVETLREYVYQNVRGYVAPASPDRILRNLRQRGTVNYTVVSRSKSLYKSLPLAPPMSEYREQTLF